MTLNRIFFHKESHSVIMPQESMMNRAGRSLLLAAIMLLSATYSTATIKVVYDRYHYMQGATAFMDGICYERPQVFAKYDFPNDITSETPQSTSYYPSWAMVCDIADDKTNAVLKNKARIQQVTLPVRVIANRAFLENKKLKVVDARPLRQLASVDILAFCNCISLDTVYLPEATDAQYYLKEISNDVFLDCRSLKYVNIPVKVEKIGQSAFRRCMSLPAIGIPYTVKSIMAYAFESCTSLESVVLPTNLGNLEEGAFQNCTALKSAGFYNKQLLRIRPLAFDGCVSLEEVTIAYDKVYAIDSCAFRGCTSLRKFTIPASLTQGVGPLAFEGCTALDTVTSLADVPPAMGRDAFRDVSPTCVLTVPYGRTQAYRAAGWSEEVFKGGIVEMPAPAGISTIKVKPKDTRYYDLEGRPVTRPEKGRIYIHDGRKVMER